MDLYSHQLQAIDKLKTGSILYGGVGSGKSRASIGYFYFKECNGSLTINGKGTYKKMTKPKDLYIITTARKRDTLEWEKELVPFGLTKKNKVLKFNIVIDSWNNIMKYKDVKKAFFIFDEQRLVGSGAWVKSFLKIAKSNNWIILSGTPGDTWTDYIPVFVANGFYKNRTEFCRTHIVYSRFAKYPKIEYFYGTKLLKEHRDEVIVRMDYTNPAKQHYIVRNTKYSKAKMDEVTVKRWNSEKKEPIKSASEVCYLARRVVNSDPSRIEETAKLVLVNDRTIIFYNFNYELELLRKMTEELKIKTNEWNGHKHEPIPKTKKWVYLVQYTAGAEGWNCVETNVIIFYSQNYSYKIMAQAAGRIDRLNTKYTDLYYYRLKSKSKIDESISRAISTKKEFNVHIFDSQ